MESTMDEVSHYENLRKRNLEDNKIVLAKLMEGLDHKKKTEPQIPKKKRTPKPVVEPVIRRNPMRSKRFTPARFDLPNRRARSGSISSTVSSTSSMSSTPSSSLSSTPEKMVVRFGFFKRTSPTLTSQFSREEEELSGSEEEDVPLPQGPRRISKNHHEVKAVEDITQADLDMVAVIVSDKKYDSIYGTTCHQCRQKTDDMKTICRSPECRGVRGQFCGPCLKNRYGEDAKVALLDRDWTCPPCRGICNCSFCRRKSGKSSTGILVHIARERGFSDVNSYLQDCKK